MTTDHLPSQAERDELRDAIDALMSQPIAPAYEPRPLPVWASEQ